MSTPLLNFQPSQLCRGIFFHPLSTRNISIRPPQIIATFFSQKSVNNVQTIKTISFFYKKNSGYSLNDWIN